MSLAKLYTFLSLVAGSVGIGMILGAQLANGTSNSPYWVGGILVFLGSVTFGMSISSRNNPPKTIDKQDTPTK